MVAKNGPLSTVARITRTFIEKSSPLSQPANGAEGASGLVSLDARPVPRLERFNSSSTHLRDWIIVNLVQLDSGNQFPTVRRKGGDDDRGFSPALNAER